MRSGRWALFMLVLSLGCLVMFASSASASSKRRPNTAALLPARSCQGLLSKADFPPLKELNGPNTEGVEGERPYVDGKLKQYEGVWRHGIYETTCEFYYAEPPQPTMQEEMENPFVTKHEGVQPATIELEIFDQRIYQHSKSLAQLPVVWPKQGFTKRLVHVPERAWVGYNEQMGLEEEGIGVADVRNDAIAVGGRGPVLKWLETAAHNLCPKCTK